MAIQQRRGLYKDFDKSKMLPAEYAVTLGKDATADDTNYERVYATFSNGSVKRMMTVEDAANQLTEATETATKQADADATLAKSYAVGGTSSRTGEDTDNAKYYKEQAATSATSASTNAVTATEKASEATTSATDASNSATSAAQSAANAEATAASLNHAYYYAGSCATADLPTTGQKVGMTYNLTDAGTYGPAGTNVAWNGTEWDALAGIVDLSGYQTIADLATSMVNSSTKAVAASLLYSLIGTDTLTTTSQTVKGAINEINSNSVYPNAGAHNSIYRGKDITANVTDGSFYTNIKNGTFKDIYIGDYFTKTVNGTAYVFRVAGCDVYLYRGDTAFTSHHVVVVPDGSFGSYQMNSSNTTSGGYVGSAMYTGTLVTWAGYLATAFGSNLLTNREMLTNAISGELPSSWSWYDSKVNLMTPEEVVGHGGFGMSGFNYGYNVGIACGQLPLFRLAPDKICNRTVYWLRTITGSTSFASVAYGGNLDADGASATRGLRPRFLLG